MVLVGVGAAKLKPPPGWAGWLNGFGLGVVLVADAAWPKELLVAICGAPKPNPGADEDGVAGVPKAKPPVDGAILVSAGFWPKEKVAAGVGSAGFELNPNGAGADGAAASAGLLKENPAVAVGVELPSAGFCSKEKPVEVDR